MKRIIDGLFVLVPAGRGARRVVAGAMLLMAGGRFGWWSTQPQTAYLTTLQYGVILMILGLALLPNGHFRLHPVGRVIAGLGALLLATMAYDVPAWGMTRLLYGYLSLVLLRETFTNTYDC